jgi:hypothetical protein
MSKVKIQGNASGTGVGIDDNATSTAITIDASENVAMAANLNSTTIRASGTSTADYSRIGALDFFSTLVDDIRWLNNTNLRFGTHYSRDLIFLRGAAEVARVTADGITFNGDTAAANALDDYEVGSWTPHLDGFTDDASSVGTYVKVGDIVTLNFYYKWTAHTSSGNPYMNLPITASNYANKSRQLSFHLGEINSGNAMDIIGSYSTNPSRLYCYNHTGTTYGASTFSTSGTITGSITYKAA